MTDADCPFQSGDKVRYEPSPRQLGLEVMSSSEGRLAPGETYIVESIQQGGYVVVKGYKHPGGGLHWTSFKRV